MEEKKVLIREWRTEDAKDLSLMLNNQKVLSNLRDGLPYPYTQKDALSYINTMLSADREKTFAFAITLNDRVIGSIGVFRQENIHYMTGEMGYYIGEPYWGKGYGTEAVRQTVDYVFQNSNLNRIYAEPFAYNTGSCRILEKNGFEFEGVLRNNAIKNGKVLDMRMYSRIRTYFTELETERLVLKNIAEDDADFLLRHFSNDTVNRYLYDAEPFTDISEAEELIGFYTETQPKLQYRWILQLKDTGEKIGTCGFHCWDVENGTTEIGYDLEPKYFRQGYMSEALESILAFADGSMHVKSIMAHIYPGNTASVELARKFGFEYMGEDVTYHFRGTDYLHHVYQLQHFTLTK